MATSIPPYQYLYRVLRKNEDVKEGLMAKKPDAQMDVETFVGHGSEWGCQSQYISTSSSKESAIEWAMKGFDYKQIGRSIATINTSCMQGTVIYFDLTNEDIRNNLISDSEDGTRARHFANYYNEVLIVGTIPANAIVDKQNV